MAEVTKGMEMFGSFDEEGDNLVVRLLAKRYGTSIGWYHWDNWAVIAPGFIPDEWFSKMLYGVFPNPCTSGDGFALAVDLYAGEWLVLSDVRPVSAGGGEPPTPVIKARGTFRVADILTTEIVTPGRN